MIISIKTKSSDVFEKFCKNFLNPPTVWKQFTHTYAFTTKKVSKVNDVTIFEFESFIDIIARRGLILGVSAFFVGYILNLPFVTGLGLFFTLLPMLILSSSVRQLMFLAELKRGGHKDKIEFLSNKELCELLLVEVENGTTRSVRTIKK